MSDVANRSEGDKRPRSGLYCGMCSHAVEDHYASGCTFVPDGDHSKGCTCLWPVRLRRGA